MTAVTQRMQAIFDVCGLDPGVPAHRQAVEGAAAQLDGYEASDIRDRFERPPGAGESAGEGWNWYLHDFRGRKGEQPTPRWVVENIAKQPPRPVETGQAGPPGGNGSAASDLWHTDILPFLRGQRDFKGLTAAGQSAVRAIGESNIRTWSTEEVRIKYYSLAKAGGFS